MFWRWVVAEESWLSFTGKSGGAGEDDGVTGGDCVGAGEGVAAGAVLPGRGW